MVFDQVVSLAKKVHARNFLPFLSLIFQVLSLQNPKILKIVERCEREVFKLKFTIKWLEGKHFNVKPVEHGSE